MTRVLLLGAHGMLGSDLASAAPATARVSGFGRTELDIRDVARIATTLDDIEPDWVLNAAAYTAVDRAETDYEAALAVNGGAVESLGRTCATRGIRLVHFSTDYVFRGDGTRPYREDDAVEPINAYGRSKLAGELALAASGAHALVLRTQWLFGARGKSFPRTMWDRAMKRSPTRVVSDQVGRPTSTVDLAKATWALMERDAHGAYHVVNSGEPATWFDVARAVFQAAGAAELISPCTTADYPTPAARPAYSALDATRLSSAMGMVLPPWRESLATFVDILRGETGG